MFCDLDWLGNITVYYIDIAIVFFVLYIKNIAWGLLEGSSNKFFIK